MHTIPVTDIWILVIAVAIATAITTYSFFEPTITRLRHQVADLEDELEHYRPSALEQFVCGCTSDHVDPDCTYFRLIAEEQDRRNKARAELDRAAESIGWN